MKARLKQAEKVLQDITKSSKVRCGELSIVIPFLDFLISDHTVSTDAESALAHVAEVDPTAAGGTFPFHAHAPRCPPEEGAGPGPPAGREL